MLKLIRNWLFDTGFALKESTTVTKEPLQALVNLTSLEVNPCWKINQNHIDCEKSKRQNVKMAAQLQSHSVSTALLRYLPGPDKTMAKYLGHFIGDVNIWFDIFNSYPKNGSVPTKNCYGVNLKMQEEHLQKFIETISSMRATGKNSLQKGMIISIKALQMLYKDMQNVYNVQYICTHKSRWTRKFFLSNSLLRTNEHPSPLEALSRIKMIILGKNSGILEAKVNTEEMVNEQYITHTILEKVKLQLKTSVLEQTTSSNSSSSFSSTGSTTVSCHEKCVPETTTDALEYIAGYLAKKHKINHPELGAFTYKIKNDHLQYSVLGAAIVLWGTKPSLEWLEKIKKWNFYFEKYANNIIKLGPGVVKKLAHKIKKNEGTTPIKIIYDFCKLRIIIRINYNNFQAQSKKDVKRKLLTTDDGQKSKIRKLKKIVN